ncbi:hypothetical protein T492DRAFT_1008217 [Pavlovales sp. CCMP2436]|nr:hypothetical protein T492DRAFT_1008217 [Pavlovales sp. CCMP2436]
MEPAEPSLGTMPISPAGPTDPSFGGIRISSLSSVATSRALTSLASAAAASSPAKSDEAAPEVNGVEAIPRLVDAVRRKLEEALSSSVKTPEKQRPLYLTLNMRGRALFDLAFVISRLPAGSKEAARALELCERSSVAWTMVRIIDNERNDGDGFAAKSAVLALSVLANLACINGHVLLMRAEINALGLFVVLLNDAVAQAQSALVLPYAIAGVRNLANQAGAAETLRKSGGEAALRDLLARPDIAEVLDETTILHVQKALLLVNSPAVRKKTALSSAAARISKVLPSVGPAGKKRAPLSPEERASLAEEHRRLTVRHAAAVLIQKMYRGRKGRIDYHFARRVACLDELHVGPTSTMMDLLRGLHDKSADERELCILALATFAASCSSLRLAELAVHLDEVVGLLMPSEHLSTQAYAACIVANLSYTHGGQTNAIYAGAVVGLLGVLRNNAHATGTEGGQEEEEHEGRVAAMTQAAAALQNLTFELAPVCDELVQRGAVVILDRVMDEQDEMCCEYAAGVLSNLDVYASEALDESAASAIERARAFLAGKHERAERRQEEGAQSIQRAWRKKHPSVRNNSADPNRVTLMAPTTELVLTEFQIILPSAPPALIPLPTTATSATDWTTPDRTSPLKTQNLAPASRPGTIPRAMRLSLHEGFADSPSTTIPPLSTIPQLRMGRQSLPVNGRPGTIPRAMRLSLHESFAEAPPLDSPSTTISPLRMGRQSLPASGRPGTIPRAMRLSLHESFAEAAPLLSLHESFAEAAPLDSPSATTSQPRAPRLSASASGRPGPIPRAMRLSLLEGLALPGAGGAHASSDSDSD